jgi:hypothetical protein
MYVSGKMRDFSYSTLVFAGIFSVRNYKPKQGGYMDIHSAERMHRPHFVIDPNLMQDDIKTIERFEILATESPGKLNKILGISAPNNGQTTPEHETDPESEDLVNQFLDDRLDGYVDFDPETQAILDNDEVANRYLRAIQRPSKQSKASNPHHRRQVEAETAESLEETKRAYRIRRLAIFALSAQDYTNQQSEDIEPSAQTA